MYHFFLQNLTPILVFLTYALNAVTVYLLLVLIFREKQFSKKTIVFLKKKGVLIAFVVSLGAFVGSLIYSNMIGFQPCYLCWWERILIYPLVVIYGVGLYLKERSVWLYSFIFTSMALVVSGYHSYIRLAGSESALCIENAVSCTKEYVNGYGYVTIPTMALSTVLFLFILTLIDKKSYNKINEK